MKAQIPPIKKTGDTLTYTVAKFIDVNDKAIEDVLKKMRGIDIEKGGKIKYQGEAISKFYVENMPKENQKHNSDTISAIMSLSNN